MKTFFKADDNRYDDDEDEFDDFNLTITEPRRSPNNIWRRQTHPIAA